ncbi:MAG TPA: dipeptidase [Vicinamibacterales bacterium]|nr:dipeptidase [Vicinamibacterales bacterium]HPW20822.1 dipeptidase [Vicinamibacterales bacterium]
MAGRRAMGAVAVAACVAAGAAVIMGQQDEARARAEAIHAKALTLDSHVDIAMRAGDYGVLTPGQKCDLVKMRQGGLKGVFLAAYVGQRQAFDGAAYKAAFDAAMRQLDFLHALTERQHPDLCAFAASPDEVERIAATGKRAIMTGLENGYPIGEDLATLRAFFDRGVRYVTLTHSGHNQIGDSSSDRTPPRHNGLSPFGERVVAEMNRLGIMVDVSHAAASTFWDVIRVSTAPVIASHSGCKAVHDVDRNLDDDQLRALAKNGGVIQIVALGSYLRADSPERAEALRTARAQLGFARAGEPGAAPGAEPQTPEQQAEAQKRRDAYFVRMGAIDEQFPAATLKDFVDHLDHAVKVAGIDHVGIGTDFDGGGGIPGFNSHAEALNVTEALVRRGYAEADILKIWGGNLMRVWREVQGEAARRQAPDAR